MTSAPTAPSSNSMWTLGVVEDLTLHSTGTYTLNVRYSDGITDTLEYPDPNNEVKLLIPSKSGTMYSTLIGNTPAYDLNPSSLFIGDYVECHFQNGADCGHWWQGRIAFVSHDNSFANVAYFDGQVSDRCKLDKVNSTIISFHKLSHVQMIIFLFANLVRSRYTFT